MDKTNLRSTIAARFNPYFSNTTQCKKPRANCYLVVWVRMLLTDNNIHEVNN